MGKIYSIDEKIDYFKNQFKNPKTTHGQKWYAKKQLEKYSSTKEKEWSPPPRQSSLLKNELINDQLNFEKKYDELFEKKQVLKERAWYGPPHPPAEQKKLEREIDKCNVLMETFHTLIDYISGKIKN